MTAAVIFDLDGTIIDSESEWEEVYRRVWEEYRGKPVREKQWMHVPGMGLEPNWRKWVKDEAVIQKLTSKTFQLYEEVVAGREGLQVREGVVEAVEKVKERGWLTALATGSNWGAVEKELEQLSLYLGFDVTTTGEEVLVQKPNPEMYLLTAQKLGVEPEECIVVEDSLPGVEAGVDAGAQVAGLVTEYSTETILRAGGATWVIHDMRELVELFNSIKQKEQVNSSDGEDE